MSRFSGSRTRVVTAVDGEGRSVIVDQGPCRNVISPLPGLVIAEQWAAADVGAGLLDAPDSSNAGFSAAPPPGGALFRLVEFPPDPSGQLHRTPTVDLVTLISGELVLALDGGEEVTLRAGDTAIQRGATHAWRNLGDEPALAAVVMISAEG